MSAKIKVLIIEDDPFLSKVYESSFADSGYEVGYTHDGEEGLAAIRIMHPDVVLLDLVMPKKDGFDVLAEVQGDPSLTGVKIVVLTNLGQPEDRAKCLNLGAVDYLVKTDISIMDLVAKVADYAK